MKKISFKDNQTAQIIDTRLQKAFQTGSLNQAINIPLAKFEKFALQLLDVKQPIVFILSKEAEPQAKQLEEQALALGFQSVLGYLLSEELPIDKQQVTKTITAKNFLTLETDYLLLDVRDQATVTKLAPEKNLVKLSINDLVKGMLDLDPTKEIYTLCGSGNSATTAASFLNKQGRKATVIEGGVTAIHKEKN